MTIYKKIKKILANRKGEIITPAEIKHQLKTQFGTNPSSVILSDYCYNRFNKGVDFNQHLFQYLNRSSYKYLGEDYPFTGLIFHKPQGHNEEKVVGEWKNGKKLLYKEEGDQPEKISKEQIVQLYENYSEILRNEIHHHFL